ncbi:hypothetical protein ACVIW0_001930 [Bradyrhizobium sp. USDA 4454]
MGAHDVFSVITPRVRVIARLSPHVVPAKAGTHSHRVVLLKYAVAPASHNNAHLG